MNTPVQPREWQHFLDLLAREPNVSRAAQQAGLTPAQVYAKRGRDPDFAQAWDVALEFAVAEVEHQVFLQAFVGVPQSKVINPTLALVYLRRWRTEYRDRQTVDMNAAHTLGPLTDEQRGQMVADILAPVAARITHQDYDLG